MTSSASTRVAKKSTTPIWVLSFYGHNFILPLSLIINLPSIEAYFLSNQELNISCQKKQWKKSLTCLESTEKKYWSIKWFFKQKISIPKFPKIKVTRIHHRAWDLKWMLLKMGGVLGFMYSNEFNFMSLKSSEFFIYLFCGEGARMEGEILLPRPPDTLRRMKPSSQK